jgi:hypothetical protein
LLAIGYWLLAIGCWLLAVGCEPVTVCRTGGSYDIWNEREAPFTQHGEI